VRLRRGTRTVATRRVRATRAGPYRVTFRTGRSGRYRATVSRQVGRGTQRALTRTRRLR
jgi:hypothetical protein